MIPSLIQEPEIKVSIIIPMYNVELYIGNLIDSLMDQLTQEVEIIFINDGSKDQTLEILSDKISNHPFKNFCEIVNQDNKGLSESRNIGVSIAKGKFIAFIDSDDVVKNDYIETLLRELNSNVDILSFEATAVSEDLKKELWHINNLPSGNFHQNKFFLKQVFKECSWQPWLRVVRSDLLKTSHFPSDLFLEDVHVFVKIYLKDTNIKHIKSQLVLYRQRETSAMHQSKQSEKIIKSYKEAIDLLKSLQLTCSVVKFSLYKLNLNYYKHISHLKGSIRTLLLMFRDKAYFISIAQFSLYAFKNFIKKFYSK